MRVGYIVNQYPKISHTFIRREILALERQGLTVIRMALRGWDAEVTDARDESERTRTRYVLRTGLAPLISAAARLLVSRPGAFLRTLSLAVRMGWRADRPLPLHLVYFLEACLLESWVRKEGISHLHAHFGTNPAEVAMLTASLSKIPWSFTVHGPEEFDKPHFLRLRDKIADARFVAAISSFGRSQLLRQAEHEFWRKIEIVHCGLDADFFDQAPAPPHAGTLVCVGRLCEQKGQLLLLEAARELASCGLSFKLVLAGDGEMRDELERTIDRYDLRARVQITGWLNEEEVRREIANSRALVLPSFAEGLPVVIMEAMALGRPVISTYIAGIPELVEPGQHGWLVPAGDVAALADAMRACLAAPVQSIEEMGAAARRRVRERHDIDNEASKLVRLFGLSTEATSAGGPPGDAPL